MQINKIKRSPGLWINIMMKILRANKKSMHVQLCVENPIYSELLLPLTKVYCKLHISGGVVCSMQYVVCRVLGTQVVLQYMLDPRTKLWTFITYGRMLTQVENEQTIKRRPSTAFFPLPNGFIYIIKSVYIYEGMFKFTCPHRKILFAIKGKPSYS